MGKKKLKDLKTQNTEDSSIDEMGSNRKRKAQDEEAEQIHKKKSKKKEKKKDKQINIASNKSKSCKDLPDAKQSAGIDNDEDAAPKLTKDQIAQMNLAENIPNIETVRKKKRKRHQKNVAVKVESSLVKDIQRNEEYLLKWKNNKSEWKFEKLRQISIQQSILDETKINEELWPIATEYLVNGSERTKEILAKVAENEMKRFDEEIEMTNNQDVINRNKYRRCRELLQLCI